MIDLNEYLASFPGAALADKIYVTELNDIILNSMPGRWSKQAYVQGLDCEYILLKKTVNMFKRIEMAESVYKGVVELSYKSHTRSDTNRAGNRRNKRVEAALSKTHHTTVERAS